MELWNTSRKSYGSCRVPGGGILDVGLKVKHVLYPGRPAIAVHLYARR